MARIEKFLGRPVEAPEDLRYHPPQGLWVKLHGTSLVFGLTEPALILTGGLNDLDWLVPEGGMVQKGAAVVFAVTGKILYLEAPLSGRIRFNERVKASPSLVAEATYGDGWLFEIAPEEPPAQVFQRFCDVESYLRSLRGTDGHKNPEGLKGGVSGICKAVYTGIREQKI
jgi:glycine cleavage system H lipoate-binding protein